MNYNLQQWWESTHRHHEGNQHVFDPSELTTKLFRSGGSAAGAGPSLDNLAASAAGNDYDADSLSLENMTGGGGLAAGGSLYGNVDEANAIPSLTLLFMAISYGLVVFGGVLGNATLVLTLCSASSVRLRNPLLLAVCIADLLVTGISAPLTLLNLAMNRKTKSLPLVVCKVIHYVQVMPVAASTISFFMLSLDRYATVKHPRLAQLRQRRYLHASLALGSWLTSAVISTPFLFAYKMIAKSVAPPNGGGHEVNRPPGPVGRVGCSEEVGSSGLLLSFVIFHTVAVFVVPGVGVLLNHYGVRRKLCALSLRARAAHGELPLPMPILRRQTHMVIVTGVANAQQAAGGGQTDDTSQVGGSGDGLAEGSGDIQMQNLNPRSGLPPHCSTFKSSNPISPRAMREIRNHARRQRISHNPATPGIPLPQTSTLRSRRRLANMLIASALIFIVCWSPHVFCIFYTNFGYKQYCSRTSIYFNLLLGYMYSAVSPVIYWILNHNTLRQSPCAPIIRLRSMQNFLRTHFRSHTVPPPPPSSTNEAALGAFNPKLIKLTPKQYRAQASSHYLY